jgi:D-xylose transport system ATP-binding protein
VQTAQILKLIERLRDRGLGVIVISHNLANVFEVADRIAVLRLGRMAATLETRDVSREEVVGAITGAEFGDEERPTEETPL